MAESKKRLIIRLGTIFLLIGVLAGVWVIADNFLKRQEEGADVIQAVICDFQQEPCKAIRGNQQIIFAIDAETVASFVPLDFRVELVGLEADEVTIDFQGVEMFMGLNQLGLIHQANGSFAGTRTLPGHMNQSMVWRAKIFIRQGEQMSVAWFDFEAE